MKLLPTYIFHLEYKKYIYFIVIDRMHIHSMINSFQQTIDRSSLHANRLQSIFQVHPKVWIPPPLPPRDAARTGLIDLAPNVAVFYTRQ